MAEEVAKQGSSGEAAARDKNDQPDAPAPPKLQRQLTAGSSAAVDYLLDKVTGADYQRGR
jgi:hypothetical protein